MIVGYGSFLIHFLKYYKINVDKHDNVPLLAKDILNFQNIERISLKVEDEVIVASCKKGARKLGEKIFSEDEDKKKQEVGVQEGEEEGEEEIEKEKLDTTNVARILNEEIKATKAKDVGWTRSKHHKSSRIASTTNPKIVEDVSLDDDDSGGFDLGIR